MILRGLLFVAWAVIGTAASYGLPYALSPYGMLILGTCLFSGLALPQPGGTVDPLPLAVAGTSFIGTALVAYMLVGRARCARSA